MLVMLPLRANLGNGGNKDKTLRRACGKNEIKINQELERKGCMN